MNQIITNAFEESLKTEGFVKRSGTWYLNREQTLLVANLQKSQYGDKYYINLAVWMKKLGEQRFPKEHLCHIRLRLTSIVDGALEKALDGEDRSSSEMDRQVVIDGAMRR